MKFIRMQAKTHFVIFTFFFVAIQPKPSAKDTKISTTTAEVKSTKKPPTIVQAKRTKKSSSVIKEQFDSTMRFKSIMSAAVKKATVKKATKQDHKQMGKF